MYELKSNPSIIQCFRVYACYQRKKNFKYENLPLKDVVALIKKDLSLEMFRSRKPNSKWENCFDPSRVEDWRAC